MNAYNAEKRVSSDFGGSVNYTIAKELEGICSSGPNKTATYIPCGLAQPEHLHITPVKSGSDSANGKAFFTTVVGWEVDSFDTLSTVSDLDGIANNTKYLVGTVIKATPSGGSEAAYICVEEYTSDSSATIDEGISAGYWQLLSETTFVKITHSAPGASKYAHFHYRIIGK